MTERSLRHLLVVASPAMQHTTAYHRGVELARRTGARLTLLLADHSAALARSRLVDTDLFERAVEGYLSARRRWLDNEVAELAKQGIEADGVAVWHKPAYEEIARQALQRMPDLVIKDVGATPQPAVFTPADWHLMRLCPVPLMLVHPHSSAFPQRILAAVDPFDARGKPAELNDDILALARSLARPCDASVDVVHVHEYLPAAVPLGAEAVLASQDFFDTLREEHRTQFLAFGSRHDIATERMHLLQGEPAPVISSLAEDIKADAVVLGTVHRRGLKRVLMGSTAEDILGHIRCDVVVLKPKGFAETVRAELNERLAAGDTPHTR